MSISGFFTDLENDCQIAYKSAPSIDVEAKVLSIRRTSIALRVSGIALGILGTWILLNASTIFLLPVILASFIVAHDCVRTGINQSKAISSTNPIKPDSLKDATVGLLQRIGNTGKAVLQELSGENYQFENTLLFKHIDQFIKSQDKT